jgi:Sec-independent protein secretion pathway component TatC
MINLLVLYASIGFILATISHITIGPVDMSCERMRKYYDSVILSASSVTRWVFNHLAICAWLSIVIVWPYFVYVFLKTFLRALSSRLRRLRRR